MRTQVVSGQKVLLRKVDDSYSRFAFQLKAKNRFRGLFDMDLFAVSIEDSNIVNKCNIVYYNNIKDLQKSIQYSEMYNCDLFEKNIDINLKSLPNTTTKVLMISTLYSILSDFDVDKEIEYSFCAIDKSNGSIVFELADKITMYEDHTLVLGEVYKYKDTWKFNTVNNYSAESLFGVLRTVYNAVIY